MWWDEVSDVAGVMGGVGWYFVGLEWRVGRDECQVGLGIGYCGLILPYGVVRSRVWGCG